jgi:hypothetical protein
MSYRWQTPSTQKNKRHSRTGKEFFFYCKYKGYFGLSSDEGDVSR